MVTPKKSQRVGTKKPINGASPTVEATVPEIPEPKIEIEADVILELSHADLSHTFRANTATLKAKSAYFTNLLSARFDEGCRIEKDHASLREKHGSISAAPPEELPVIRIEDLGRLSEVKSIAALCNDFFNFLHGINLPQDPPPPVANLANLTIVADRFDALAALKACVQKRKILRAIDRKTTSRAEIALTEEKVRQRMLIATLLDDSQWLERYSTRMISNGWVGEGNTAETSALWWDLPMRLEEELAFRRECILETFQSLQTFYLNLYTSRERQCKLGYDSSPQCDTFQLGELIRYFSRVGTIQLRGTIVDTNDEAPAHGYDATLLDLVHTFRQVSEYQIDQNHNHCGIRTRILPILDVLVAFLSFIGIHGEDWRTSRLEDAWLTAKRPKLCTKKDLQMSASLPKDEKYARVRKFFTALERDWSDEVSASHHLGSNFGKLSLIP
jgi:hypothetical protein